MSEVLPHTAGSVRLIDVSERPVETRTAVASGRVRVGEGPFRLIEAGAHPKGDVLTVAQVSGILGAKQTSRLLPLCQDVMLRGVEVELGLDEADFAVTIRAYVKAHGPTGVAMEALTAVSVAALAIFDLCRSAARDAEITDIRLVAKTGGHSGDFLRRDLP